MSYVFFADNTIENKIINAKTWIASTFGDYKSVLQFEDNTTGRIIIKGNTPSVRDGMYKYNITMIFDFKDDKFRIKVEDIKEILKLVNIPVPLLPSHFEPSLTSAQKMEIEKCKKNIKRINEKLINTTGRNREELIEILNEREATLKQLEKENNLYLALIREKNILEFRTLFFNIIKSASDKISEKDDF